MTATEEPAARADPAILLVWPPSPRAPEANGTDTHAPGPRSSGRWLVRTETATYVIDLDAAVVSRFPGRATSDDVRVTDLRRDSEEIALRGLVAVLGQPMRMSLALVPDGRTTLRTTTTTLAIEPAPLAPPSPQGVERRRTDAPRAAST